MRLDGLLAQADPIAVLNDALAHFDGYHARPALRRIGEQLEHGDRSLLLFYAHRLRGFDLLPKAIYR